MRLLRLASLSVVAAAALVGAPATARADAEGDAKDLFVRGREARAKGDCAAASPLFRKAWTVFPKGLGSLRNHAECEESLGRFASSRRAWLDLKRALVVESDPKYAGWDADSDAAATRLAPRVARLKIDLAVKGPSGDVDPSRVEGLRVTVNGEPVEPALLGTDLDRDPGSFAVRAEAPNTEGAADGRAEVGAGEARTVTLRLVQTAAARPPVAAGTTDAPAEEKRGGGATRTLGWVALGVGGALVAGSVVSLVVRQGALSDLESQCPGYESGPCPRSVESTVSRGEVAGVLFPVLGITGLAAAGTGVALLLTSPASKPAATSARKGPTIDLRPTLGGLVCQGTF